MERTTVMLPRGLKEDASEVAKQRHLSVGELIREALREKIRGSQEPSKNDPFFADSEVFRGEAPSDASARHDDYLYGPKT